MEHSNHSSGLSDTDLLDFDEIKVADEGFKSSTSEVEHLSQSSGKSDSTDFTLCDSLKPHDSKTTEQDEKELILIKLKELSQKRQNQDACLMDNVEGSTLVKEIRSEDSREQMEFMQKNEESACSSSQCQSVISQLIQEMEELSTFKAEQQLKMIQMEQKLAAAEKEIQWLKDHLMLDSLSNHSIEHSNRKAIEPIEELQLDPTESIFLVGGYDGESWLSAFHSYFPSQDVVKSFQPMSSVRSYAAAAQLNGELYVIGGGDGNHWYNTVEIYSSASDQWTLCPSLKEKKGSLAGAALDGKIFAFGGGNGIGCFSEVEMLDLIVGRWINTRSMLQKRFALAAVELNGAIYATGGYDGNNYLKSAERFDPREHSWTKIASMSTQRGCHSLVVLDEKLYAIGGYDGTNMVSSVEIFDPRLGSWMSGDPINQARGYAAAAVVKGSIYVIGGLRADEDIVDSVECFKEGQGWQVKTSKAIGKRCFLSAVALKS
ncbi:Kelch repeat type 1 [Corchorus olitorius]|uniref:Kelch repeat type 1 n=1 Tax=Corchorus olitorius TaxID=93759 RepID=A0A1R3JS61_9ROSI|nr:Kelch repeat type 1 [Corchorus olitorius]